MKRCVIDLSAIDYPVVADMRPRSTLRTRQHMMLSPARSRVRGGFRGLGARFTEAAPKPKQSGNILTSYTRLANVVLDAADSVTGGMATGIVDQMTGGMGTMIQQAAEHIAQAAAAPVEPAPASAPGAAQTIQQVQASQARNKALIAGGIALPALWFLL
jgi:hypothetical protein